MQFPCQEWAAEIRSFPTVCSMPMYMEYFSWSQSWSRSCFILLLWGLSFCLSVCNRFHAPAVFPPKSWPFSLSPCDRFHAPPVFPPKWRHRWFCACAVAKNSPDRMIFSPVCGFMKIRLYTCYRKVWPLKLGCNRPGKAIETLTFDLRARFNL